MSSQLISSNITINSIYFILILPPPLLIARVLLVSRDYINNTNIFLISILSITSNIKITNNYSRLISPSSAYSSRFTGI